VYVVWGGFSRLSLIMVAIAYRLGQLQGGTVAGLIVGGTMSVWYQCVYYGPRTLTGVIGAHLLVGGIWLMVEAMRRQSRPWFIAGGAVLGAVVAVRLHLAPAVAVIGLIACCWYRRRWLWALTAGAAAVLLAGLVDWWTWGAPFYSFYQNIYMNVVKDVAASYGTQPVYWYGYAVLRRWYGLAFVIGGLALLSVRRQPMLLLAALVIVASHSLIGHKEYRFIYPGLVLLVMAAALGLARLIQNQMLDWKRFARVGVVTLVMLGVTGASAVTAWSHAVRPIWERSPAVQAFRWLSERPDVKGIVLADIPAAAFPGYCILGQDVPLFFAKQIDKDRFRSRRTNYIIARQTLNIEPDQVEKVQQFDESGLQLTIYRWQGDIGSSVSDAMRRRPGQGQPLGSPLAR
jgi:hypothetical protein